MSFWQWFIYSIYTFTSIFFPFLSFYPCVIKDHFSTTTSLTLLSTIFSLSLRYPHSTLWYVRVVHILTSTSHSSSVHIFQTQEFSSKIQFLSFLPKYKESDLQSHKQMGCYYFRLDFYTHKVVTPWWRQIWNWLLDHLKMVTNNFKP